MGLLRIAPRLGMAQEAACPITFSVRIPRVPTNDYNNISRNKDLYSYLQRLTKDSVPGFGGNFFSKYGSDHDQNSHRNF
jgi:hypothetical protein